MIKARSKTTMNALKSNDGINTAQKRINCHVGMRLRLLRMAKGWSQSHLAAKIEISYQQVQKYETGSNRIGAGRLWQLCQVFEIQPNTLFEGLEDHNPDTKHDDKDATDWSCLMSRQNHNFITAFAEIKDASARSAIITLCDFMKTKTEE